MFQPSPEQQTIFDTVLNTTDDIAIAALAGTGKTTTLVELAKRLPPNGSKLFCAFNKDIVSELEKRLTGTGMKAQTFHSIGFSGLKNHLGITKMAVESNKYRRIISEWADLSLELREAIAQIVMRFPPDEREKLSRELHKEMVKMLVELTSFLRYKLVEWDDVSGLRNIVSHYDLDEDLLDSNELVNIAVDAVPGLMNTAEKQVKEALEIDFTDMIYWVVRWQVPIATYSWVFVDECLPYHTPIQLADGTSKTIGDIAEQKLPVEVLAYDTASRSQKACRVIGWSKILNQKPLVKIKVRWTRRHKDVVPDGYKQRPTNFVVCTVDHKVWADNQWRYAGDVRPGMTMQVETSAHKSQAYKITSAGRSTLAATMTHKNEGRTQPNPGGHITQRGGNGRGLSLAEQTLLDALGEGWLANYPIPTKMKRGLGYPTCYKADLANPARNIVIEVDGPSHHSAKRKALDEKKQAHLEKQGWRVFRFSNREAIQHTQTCVEVVNEDCPLDAVVVSVEDVEIPDNYVYDITVEDCHNFYANGILVHNCQDLSPMQRTLVKMAVGGRIVLVGDKHQCQPAGTMIRMADGSEKPIEQVQVGDQVVSYDRRSGHWMRRGVVSNAACRPYSGLLYAVSAGGRSTWATDNHKWLVRWENMHTDKWTTYVMRKGDYYRVGIVQMFNKRNHSARDFKVFGLAARMRSEKADAGWVIGIHDNYVDACIHEQIVSARYSLPQLTFQTTNGSRLTQANLDYIHAAIGSRHEMAAKCLADHGCNIQFPLVKRGAQQQRRGGSTYFVTESCNLIPGFMSIPVPPAEITFSPKTSFGDDFQVLDEVATETFNEYDSDWLENDDGVIYGMVYSLEIERYELYVADGILTHNSIYGFAGADYDSFDLSVNMFNAHVMPLTVTRRCPQVITQHAASIVPDFKCPPDKPKGKVVWIDENRLSALAKPGDMILSRVKAPLVGACLDLIALEKPATILGSEIGKSLIAILEKLQKRSDYRFEALADVLKKYEDEQVARHLKKHDEAKAEAVKDQCAAIHIIVERANAPDEYALTAYIEKLFSNEDGRGRIVLSTIHKAKGMEAERIFILKPEKLPLAFGNMRPEQTQQEHNLDYVARTRAIAELVYLTNNAYLKNRTKPPYVQDGFEDSPTGEKPLQVGGTVYRDYLLTAVNQLNTDVFHIEIRKPDGTIVAYSPTEFHAKKRVDELIYWTERLDAEKGTTNADPAATTETAQVYADAVESALKKQHREPEKADSFEPDGTSEYMIENQYACRPGEDWLEKANRLPFRIDDAVRAPKLEGKARVDHITHYLHKDFYVLRWAQGSLKGREIQALYSPEDLQPWTEQPAITIKPVPSTPRERLVQLAESLTVNEIDNLIAILQAAKEKAVHG